MIMMPSVEVQNKFGSIANRVKGGELVTVTQYGTPTLMILPYSVGEAALQQYNATRFARFMESMPVAKDGAPELSMSEFNDLVHELRA